MKSLKSLTLLLALLLSSSNSFGQDKWAVELRPNINFPTEKFLDTDLKTGFGFELALNYNFMEHLGAYTGWGYNTFKTSSNSSEFDNDVDMTGYTFGLQFIHPIGSSEKLSYLARAGGIYNHLEVENDSGDITQDSGHGLGWELGVGIQYDLGSSWVLRPQVGYRSLSDDFDAEGLQVDFDFNYISVGVGVVKKF